MKPPGRKRRSAGISGGQVALIVGDVSGKGLAAAAHTAEVKYALRAFLRENPLPGQALSRLNAFIHDNHRLNDGEDNAFLTLDLLIVIPVTGQVTAAAAGAEPPLILRADGTVEPLPVQGSLLGLERDVDYEAVKATLGLGDTILMVTDRITESRQGSEFLDYEGLVRLAGEVPKTALPTEIGRTILDGARAFADGALRRCLPAAGAAGVGSYTRYTAPNLVFRYRKYGAGSSGPPTTRCTSSFGRYLRPY